MEQAMEAIYFGIAAILFSVAVYFLYFYVAEVKEINEKVHGNSQEIEVYWVG